MMRIIFLCVFLVLASCKGKYLIEEPPQLVVEGWIDANGFPVVILTETLPISEDEISVLTLEEHLIKWAKVTVCDGEREVVLNGKVDKRYFGLPRQDQRQSSVHRTDRYRLRRRPRWMGQRYCIGAVPLL
jgi:hypothetical protein